MISEKEISALVLKSEFLSAFQRKAHSETKIYWLKMIRVYLDWGAISTFKTDHEAVIDFIKENKERFLFPHSPAHFNDLMKSFTPDNEKFKTDLENLIIFLKNIK